MNPPSDLPQELAEALHQVPVVLAVSPLTDARSVTRWLVEHRVPHRQVSFSMAEPASREAFARLRQATRWRGLPQIFVHGEFLGGIDEFFAHPQIRAWAREGGRRVAPQRRARLLGYGGLLPFLAGVAGMAWGSAEVRGWAEQALLAYGAVILSFVGALQWTRALIQEQPERGAWLLSVSVLPALAGWVALLLPRPWGLALLMLGFLTWYLFDRSRWPSLRWFATLRLHLTAAALASLSAGLMLAGTA